MWLQFSDVFSALRITKFHVPKQATLGSTVRFECQYNLEGEHLYDVKWYKDYREFYRYNPTESPKTKVFVMRGVKIDVSVI